MQDRCYPWAHGPLEGEGNGFRFAPGISVFFPAFNDAPSLPSLIQRTFETLRRVAEDYEVIVVNDGSSDSTAEVLEQLQREYAPYLRVVTHQQNRGYGAALRSGFATATKEYIFYTDGDGQYDPGELEKLLRASTPEAGLVNGYKMERNDPWHRIAIGWLYNQFARWLFRIKVRDIDCDFRLIRRSALDLDSLQSTSGTICLELVRSLEISGAEVVEVPVHHYARQHGSSQFFRVRSLARTFFQLCSIYWSLVILSNLVGSDERDEAGPAPISKRKVVLVAATIALLAFMAYGRSFSLPFISDDYVQISVSRDYGPVSEWGALAGDALYRCRATSIVLTYWLEKAFGLNVYYFSLASLLLHIGNALLIFAMGFWRPIGWRLSALAACFFTVCMRHSEAVVWFAAIPELLVFFFGVLCFLFWVRSIESDRPLKFWLASFACYLMALLSKESAVAIVPLCALATLAGNRQRVKALMSLAPFAAMAAGYFYLGYTARESHLHYNDGTFSLSAPFIRTLAISSGNLLWFWGVPALALLFTEYARPWRKIVLYAGIWTTFTLLPYSFLTYMPRVPSRHTYIASAGLALLMAAAMLALRRYARSINRAWLAPALGVLIILQQSSYMWTVKFHQYADRARPTEKLLKVADNSSGVIHAKCFPYTQLVAEAALRIRFNSDEVPELLTGPKEAEHPEAVDFCTAAVRD